MAHRQGSRARRIPTGRVSRLLQLGSLATGIAGNMTAQGLGQISRGTRPALRDLLLTPRNARRLADDLSRMRGAAMKVGQLLSMEAGDFLPPDLAEILARLQAAADPMPPRQLNAVLTDNWGADWRYHFDSFDVRPVATASIGQVHRARLRDGRSLAVKVQYPGVAQSVDSDVANLGALVKLSGLLPEGFDLAPYLAEARQQLRLETDYHHEARAMAEYGTLVSGMDPFEVPVPIADWSTGQVLAMSFLDSRPIAWLEQAPQAERDRVAHHLIDLTLREIFGFGVVQTDPNFANFRYNATTGRIVLLDFGATRTIDPAIVATCRDLLSAGLRADDLAVRDAATALGLLSADMPDWQSQKILSILDLAWAEIRRDVFDAGQSPLLARLRVEAAELSQARVPPPVMPMDALYLQRKVGGMLLLIIRLRARVGLRDLVERHTAHPPATQTPGGAMGQSP